MSIHLLALILLAILSLGLSSTQDECTTTESLPTGLVNKGGYSFNYDSSKGEECRIFRLRNTPKAVLTPVLWRGNRETLIDVSIPACENDCESFQAIQIGGPIFKDRSTLSFGINKDEHEEEPQTYLRPQRTQSQSKQLSPFRTILRGVLADAQGKEFEIEIGVASYVHGVRPYKLSYEMWLGEGNDSSTRLAILRPDTFPESGSAMGVLWEAVTIKQVSQYLEEAAISEIYVTPKEPGQVSHLEASFTADAVKLDDSAKLILFQGKKAIASSTAPLYRPADAEASSNH